jgi:hypothetical protein
MGMKPSRFTEEQIIGILREREGGAKTADVCRKTGSAARPECRGKLSTVENSHLLHENHIATYRLAEVWSVIY